MSKKKEYTLEAFVKQTHELVGKPVGPPTTPNSDIPVPPICMGMGVAEMKEWACHGNGDDNPLYIDPDYAAKTRYAASSQRPPSSSGTGCPPATV